MNRTRIDWADMSWNPVKGKCPEDCKTPDGKSYCYARKIYQRFGLDPELRLDYKELVAPAAFEGPARIFVCSTMEAFHPRIPEKWRMEIFNIIASLPSLTFIVLTKHPELITKAMPDNVWLGTSATGAEDWGRVRELSKIPARVKFVSLEPFIGKTPDLGRVREFDWLIVGRLTGHGRARDPEPRALVYLWAQAKSLGIPVFLKGSLTGLWPGRLVQKYPEEAELAAGLRFPGRTPAREGYPMDKSLSRGSGGRP